MQNLTSNSQIDAPQIRLLRMDDVRGLTGLSRSHIYALAADGLFPQSVPLVPGGSSRAWVDAEIQDWIHQRIQERDQVTVEVMH